MQIKSLHFQAAAQFRKSCEALASSKYGEEIARLKGADALAKKALEFPSKQVGPSVITELKVCER